MTVGIGVVTVALVGIGAAGSRAEERGVCVDRSSDVRVADDQCDDDSATSGGGYGWYYIPAGRRAPAEGQAVAGQGSFVTPTSKSFTKGGVSADGGTVTRGGFYSGKGSFGG
ncbi:hypothetical protein GEV27_08105 [Aeromicrobium sp. S22]|uniref:hypothetical protein n=1 Tax=Aeromicrobium sp. S22 TaxID=2662029 RepID=UPI00129EB069|nr:hypothetical protein [Aeromicrobium sp. S22]MRK01485.1 hypothetical protein [Aeromicrobium sp. S22]